MEYKITVFYGRVNQHTGFGLAKRVGIEGFTLFVLLKERIPLKWNFKTLT